MSRLRSWGLLAPLVALSAAVALFLLPLTAHPTWVPFAPAAEYSDALVAHLSSAAFLHRAVATWGQIPLWNATILGGLPFAADPLSGLWYPPLWVLGIFPEALTLNVLVGMHLVFGGIGMYRLLRREGLGGEAALLGGLAFAGMPKLVGHVGLGHLSLVAAVAWTPWALDAGGRAAGGIQGDAWVREAIVAGLILGAVFLADPRWLLPLTVLTLAYAVRKGWERPASRAARPRYLLGLGIAALAGISLTAVVVVPFLEFVGQTTRATLVPVQPDPYALPPDRLLGLLVAIPGGWAEWMISMGSTLFVLAAAGVAGAWRWTWFWLGAAILSVLIALGILAPIGGLIGNVPGLGLLRVPARWLFATGSCAAILAAHGLGALGIPDEGARRRARRGALAGAGAIVGIALGAIVLAGFRLEAAISGAAAIAAASATWLSQEQGRLLRRGVVLTLLLVAELTWLDASLVAPRAMESAQREGGKVVEALGDLPDGARVFSPSYSLPQDVAAARGLNLADGVHPLQLSRYVSFMGMATGMDVTTYSVTLPHFPGGSPSADWGPELDAYRLGLLGVANIVSAYPLEADGLSLEAIVDGIWFYRNTAVRSRAWIEPSEAPVPRPVDHLRWTPNRVTLEAIGPGRVVLADLDYPGWEASIDGVRAEKEAGQGILRAVQIPEGRHEVAFVFRPRSLFIGLSISLLGLVATALLWRRR